MKIPVDSITVAPGRRRVDPDWVATLAERFQTEGHQSPIRVMPTEGGFRLIFGLHRLEAARQLGWTEIDGDVVDRAAFGSEAAIALSEITENLVRRELSALDRAVDIARWRDVYEAAHGAAKPGRKKRSVEADDELSAKFALNFSEAAQRTLQLSRRSIFLALKVASIDAAARDAIALHAVADNQAELLLLAAEPPARQTRIAELLAAGTAASVTAALAVIDETPPPATEPRWQKVAASFSNLPPADQDRFFVLHEAAILRWLAARRP